MATVPVEVRMQEIQLILLDVDGVLTDGRLGLTAAGEEIKFFSIYDGLAIKVAQNAGWNVGFLSGIFVAAPVPQSTWNHATPKVVEPNTMTSSPSRNMPIAYLQRGRSGRMRQGVGAWLGVLRRCPVV